MISRISGKTTPRTLFIDFDTYTDGDLEFKKELIESMIDNLVELQETVLRASQNNDASIFQKVCHKVKPTLQMLDDKELLETVAQLKIMITDNTNAALLGAVCADIIDSLRKQV